MVFLNFLLVFDEESSKNSFLKKNQWKFTKKALFVTKFRSENFPAISQWHRSWPILSQMVAPLMRKFKLPDTFLKIGIKPSQKRIKPTKKLINFDSVCIPIKKCSRTKAWTFFVCKRNCPINFQRKFSSVTREKNRQLKGILNGLFYNPLNSTESA